MPSSLGWQSVTGKRMSSGILMFHCWVLKFNFVTCADSQVVQIQQTCTVQYAEQLAQDACTLSGYVTIVMLPNVISIKKKNYECTPPPNNLYSTVRLLQVPVAFPSLKNEMPQVCCCLLSIV